MAENSIDKLVVHIKKSTGDCRPSLKDLYDHVVPTIADRWKDVGVQLLDSALVDQRALEVIAANHPRSVEGCCKSMFEKWLSTQKKASWNQLIKAIENIGLSYLASQLKNKLEGSEVSHQQNLSPHMSTYQQRLKHKYRSMKYVPPNEMLDCSSTNYVELALRHNNSNHCITLHEALELRKRKGSILLFQGNPGVGKSTLAIHICKCWAKGDLLQDYDAVISLPLCDPEIQGAKCIGDLLLILDDDMRENVLKEVVKSDGERICFILEGYDELPKQFTHQSSIFSSLKGKLTKCMLVYTSRPEVSPEFYHCGYYWDYDLPVIVIDGFKKESVDKYISSAFENVKDGKELSDTLKSQLYNNPMVQNLLYVPINLAILCLIFFHFSTLPETLTELYTLLCLRLILRHTITRTPNEEHIEKLISLNNLPQHISEQFFQLCFLAYKGMETRTIIFNSQYLHDIGIDESKMTCLGLLQITPTTSVYGREKFYNFLHLTVQEFCTAWYISKLSTEEQMKVFEMYYYDNQFEMVWKFYSGITGLKDRRILNLMLPYKLIRSELTKIKMIKLMYHVYEARNDEVCRIVGDHCDGNFVDLYPEDLRFVTYSFNNHSMLLQVFTYFLIHYKGPLRLIDITTWHITDREITVIINSLEKRLSLQNNATSDNIIFKVSMKHITSQSYALLANLLTLQYPMAELYITHHDIPTTPTYMSVIMACKELFAHSKTLSVLDISGSKIGPKGAACLADCRNVHLQDLRMKYCNLGAIEADKIGEMLAYNKSIISIDVSRNSICDEGVKRMVHHLKHCNVLQCINVCKNNITGVGIKHLTKLLEPNSTLTSLDLSHNHLKYDDACCFLSSLNNTMEYIGLYGYQFIHEAIVAVHAVHKVKSFGCVYVMASKPLNDHEPLMNIINVIQQLEVRVANSDGHYRMIEAISSTDNIKKLKIYYNYFGLNIQMIRDLSSCLMHSQSLDELAIFLPGKLNIHISHMHGLTIILITKLLTGNTSVKKFKCCSRFKQAITLLEFQELLTELSDTIEELTLSIELPEVSSMQKCDDILQEINQRRRTKGISSPLQVNILNKNAKALT